jgi:hypothetical protein
MKQIKNSTYLRLRKNISFLFSTFRWSIMGAFSKFLRNIGKRLAQKTVFLTVTDVRINLQRYLHLRCSKWSRDISVGIARGYRLYGPGSIPGSEGFLISTASRPKLGPTQPPLQWGPGALCPGVKRLGCEPDKSPPSSTEVKKGGAIPPFPHISSWHSA